MSLLLGDMTLFDQAPNDVWHVGSCVLLVIHRPRYVVSVFEKPHWRTVLTTKDKEKAFALAKEIGDKVRIEEITLKLQRR